MNTLQSRWHALANHDFWNKPIALILTVFFFIGLIGLIRWFFFGSSLTEMLIEAVFVVAMISIGLLKAIYPRFSRIVDKGVGYYFYGTALYFISLAPIIFFLLVAQRTVTGAGPVVQYVVFSISAIFWVFLLATITYEPLKRSVFATLKSLGWILPLVFLANYVMISAVLFASLAYLFSCKTGTSCEIIGLTPNQVNFDRFLSWFIWHVADAIPAIKINQTLGWTEPLKIDAGPTLLGAWLVLFKIAVILPGLGSFIAYWKKRKEEREPISQC